MTLERSQVVQHAKITSKNKSNGFCHCNGSNVDPGPSFRRLLGAFMKYILGKVHNQTTHSRAQTRMKPNFAILSGLRVFVAIPLSKPLNPKTPKAEPLLVEARARSGLGVRS